MTFEEFDTLFQNALAVANKNAEELLHRKLPLRMKVALHGAGHSGDIMDAITASKKLYLGEDKYYRIIDLSVIKVTSNESLVFVRASDHEPGAFDQTWNNPPGSGPFKQLIAKEIDWEEAEGP